MSLRTTKRPLSPTEDSFVRRIDWDQIDTAAAYMAGALRRYKRGVVRLEPGDATVYEISISRAEDVWTKDGVGPDYRDGHLVVTLRCPEGKTYPWHGEPLTWDYCAVKWVRDGVGHQWTGMLVSEFLSAVYEANVAKDREIEAIR